MKLTIAPVTWRARVGRDQRRFIDLTDTTRPPANFTILSTKVRVPDTAVVHENVCRYLAEISAALAERDREAAA